MEENADGTRTVFVPLVPAGTSGQVYVVEPDRIRDLGIDSPALQAQLARLGQGLMTR